MCDVFTSIQKTRQRSKRVGNFQVAAGVMSSKTPHSFQLLFVFKEAVAKTEEPLLGLSMIHSRPSCPSGKLCHTSSSNKVTEEEGEQEEEAGDKTGQEDITASAGVRLDKETQFMLGASCYASS